MAIFFAQFLNKIKLIPINVKGIQLSLIDGEEREFTFDLENSSNLPIKWIDIRYRKYEHYK